MAELSVIRLGRSRYGPVWELQKRLQAERMASLEGGPASPDRLLLVEHEPVYTWGRRAKPEHLGPGPDALARLGADVFEVERGGDVTFHGPGQLVAYPIIHLGGARCGKDLHRYMRALEQICIAVCESYGVQAGREPGLTGVWVGSGKIAALGTRVSRWVTLHGLALNVTDEPLAWFAHVTPCGIKGRGVASLQTELGQAPSMEEVEARLTRAFCDELGFVPSQPEAGAATNPFSL
ncbi:MAG: lipoyl(octanoyl) transferase LipB [Planctomycetaceae bacterium]|nr:lipoyl(octanoyl) transferase [Planctomycetota bacterium]NUO14819.1 lipoyl(octanoyl) transferase LipB [Planctomycetaceae bacterium]GIK51568.1 MAG: octanoyltransferase [Planctomycetota bacterium]